MWELAFSHTDRHELQLPAGAHSGVQCQSPVTHLPSREADHRVSQGQENFEDAFYPCSPESEPSDPFMGYCQEVSPEIDPSSSHAGARTSLPTARPSKGSRRKRGMPSAEPPDIRKGSSSRHFRNSPVPGVSISPSTASEPDWKSFLHLSVGHDSPEMGSLRDSSSWETSGLAVSIPRTTFLACTNSDFL